VFLLLVLLVSCGGRGPQMPSRRMGEDPKLDSAQMALLELNRRMRTEADKELQVLSQSDTTERYALYRWGAWAHIIEYGNDEVPRPKLGQRCDIHMRVYDLKGKLYSDEELTVQLGRRDVPVAVDWNLQEWNHGAKVKMFVPWYSAYGLEGKNAIPPYENVMILLDVK